MKKVSLAITILVMSAGSAFSADLGVRPYTKAPAMIPVVYDWSGFYIGINGGGGSARNCWDLVTDVFGDLPGAEGCHNATGGTVGGQLGYRWQTGSWVWGIEGQGNWADFSGSNTSRLFAPDFNRSRLDAFGLITGQIGYAWNNALFYVKGGAAVVGDRYRTFDVATGLEFDRANDETRWGGTVGAGFEYGFVPNWAVGIEYNHIFLERRNVNFTGSGNFAGAGLGVFTRTDRIDQNVDMGL